MERVEDILQQLRDELGVVRTEVGAVRTAVGGVRTELDEVRSIVETSFSEKLDGLQGNIERKFQRIEEKMDSLHSKVGMINEVAVRREVERKYGFHYSRPFLAANLLGIARLAMPKTPIKYDQPNNDVLSQLDAAKKLSDLVFREHLVNTLMSRLWDVFYFAGHGEIPKEQSHYSFDIQGVNKLSSDRRQIAIQHLSGFRKKVLDEADDLLRELREFIPIMRTGPPATLVRMMIKGRLGLAALTCKILPRVKPTGEKRMFKPAMEFDCRGAAALIAPNKMLVSFCEIKSVPSISEGAKQLMARGALLYECARVINGNTDIMVRCILVLPKLDDPSVSQQAQAVATAFLPSYSSHVTVDVELA